VNQADWKVEISQFDPRSRLPPFENAALDLIRLVQIPIQPKIVGFLAKWGFLGGKASARKDLENKVAAIRRESTASH
jgi:hypothetical protein